MWVVKRRLGKATNGMEGELAQVGDEIVANMNPGQGAV